MMIREAVLITEVWHCKPEMMFKRTRLLTVYMRVDRTRYVMFKNRHLSIDANNNARIDLYPRDLNP